MTERAKFKGVINLIIKDGDKTLLFFRNDGFFSYGGGWWVMPAGHIEQGEVILSKAKQPWPLQFVKQKKNWILIYCPKTSSFHISSAIWQVKLKVLISFSL